MTKKLVLMHSHHKPYYLHNFYQSFQQKVCNPALEKSFYMLVDGGLHIEVYTIMNDDLTIVTI